MSSLIKNQIHPMRQSLHFSGDEFASSVRGAGLPEWRLWQRQRWAQWLLPSGEGRQQFKYSSGGATFRCGCTGEQCCGSMTFWYGSGSEKVKKKSQNRRNQGLLFLLDDKRILIRTKIRTSDWLQAIQILLRWANIYTYILVYLLVDSDRPW